MSDIEMACNVVDGTDENDSTNANEITETLIRDTIPRLDLNAFLLVDDGEEDYEFEMDSGHIDEGEDQQAKNKVDEDELHEVLEASDMSGVSGHSQTYPADLRNDFELSSDSDISDYEQSEREKFITANGKIVSEKRSRDSPIFEYVIYNCEGHRSHHKFADMQSLRLHFLGGVLDPVQTKAAEFFRGGNSVIYVAPPGTGKSMFALYAAQMAVFSAKAWHRTIVVVADKIQCEAAVDRLKLTAIHNLEIYNGEDECRGIETDDPICMVITVDVLRYKLLHDKKFRKEIRSVIIDDVDQISNEDYGFLFEEVITLLPKGSKCCFTLNSYSNIEQFMRYLVARLNQNLHLVMRRSRPRRVDRQVAMVSLNETKTFLVASKNTFHAEEYAKAKFFAMHSRKMADEKAFCRSIVEKSKSVTPIVETLRQHLIDTDCIPIMIVTFSVEECEEYALQLGALSMFVDSQTQYELMRAFERFMGLVGAHTLEEKRLNRMSRMLLNGVSFMHPGMPPTIREFVDQLYAQNFLRVLVTTEPMARHSRYRCNAVVFPSIRKFDGTRCRYITNEEVQRALSLERVKRVCQKTNNVIFILHSPIPDEILKSIVLDSPMALKFSYRPRLSTILHFPSYKFIQRMENSAFDSFSDPFADGVDQELRSLILDYEEISRLPDKRSPEWCNLKEELENLKANYEKQLSSIENIGPYLDTGRVVKVIHDGREFGWGVVIRKWEKTHPSIYLAVNVRPDCIGHEFDLKRLCPHDPDDVRSKIVQIAAFPVESVREVTRFRIKMLRNLKSVDNLNALAEDLEELVVLQNNDVERIESEEMAEIRQKIKKVEKTLEAERFKADLTEENRLKEIEKLRNRIAELTKKKSETKERSELSASSKVYKLNQLLTQLGYRLDNQNTEKGRRALKCIVGDEIGLLEIIEYVGREGINSNVELFISALLSVLQLPVHMEAVKEEEIPLFENFLRLIENALKEFEEKLEALGDEGIELKKQSRRSISQWLRYDLLQGIYSYDYDEIVTPDLGDKEFIRRRLSDYLRSYGISANYRRQFFSMLLSCMMSTGDT